MITKFNAPADITDFDRNSALADAWNQRLSESFENEIRGLSPPVPTDKICFFDPRKQPPGQLNEAHITWFGFPNILKAIYQDENKAFELGDNLLLVKMMILKNSSIALFPPIPMATIP